MQTERLTGLAVVAAVPVGLLAVALLVVNNLRDIPGDTVAASARSRCGSATARTRPFYAGAVLSVFGAVLVAALGAPASLIALLALPVGAAAIRR